MGILANYVLARTPLNAAGQPQLLVDLTNPGVSTATTVNMPQLLFAELDCESEFQLLTSVTFDTLGTTAQSPVQLAIGFYGVLSKLLDLKGFPRSKQAQACRDEWLASCVRYDKMFGSHAVQSPLTNAATIPSPEPAGSLPYFDRRILENVLPRAPYLGGDATNWPGYQ